MDETVSSETACVENGQNGHIGCHLHSSLPHANLSTSESIMRRKYYKRTMFVHLEAIPKQCFDTSLLLSYKHPPERIH